MLSKPRIALQMDPLGSINAKSDSTLALAAEASARNYTVYHYTPNELFYVGDKVFAHATEVTCRLQEEEYHTLGSSRTIDLGKDVDVVLLRQDPPFDMAYLTTTYLLEKIVRKTLVLNDPFHVRNNPEKLFPLQFSEFIAPTLIGRSFKDIEAFLRTQKEIIIKPLYSFGGQSVFHIKEDQDNLGAVLELLFNASREPVIAQKFLPEVKQGDIRVILIDGEIAGAMKRMPASGEIRANMRVGGTPQKTGLTAKQKQISEAVGAACKERGLFLVGLDLIGDYLNEINITSPTGLRAINALYNASLEKIFWDKVERAI